MIRVGLTGGYASGKSFVAGALERLGCVVIYADRLGHRVLQQDGPAYRPVVAAFGSAILNPQGDIDRKQLGSLVFADPDALARLNSIVHPAVYALEAQLLADAAARHAEIAVLEAAILIETGKYRNYDRIILTVCHEETQIARAVARDGLTPDEVRARLKLQMPVEEKKRFAHYWIDTDTSKEQTLHRIESVHHELQQLARGVA